MKREERHMNTRDAQVKLSDIVNSVGEGGQIGPLTKLLNSPLPMRLAFGLGMFTDALASPVKHYNLQREGLLKEHGTTEDDGQSYNLKGDGLARFREAMDTLGAEEVPLKIPVVKVSDLGEREILTPAECYVLRWLFAEESEAAGVGGG